MPNRKSYKLLVTIPSSSSMPYQRTYACPLSSAVHIREHFPHGRRYAPNPSQYDTDYRHGSLLSQKLQAGLYESVPPRFLYSKSPLLPHFSRTALWKSSYFQNRLLSKLPYFHEPKNAFFRLPGQSVQSKPYRTDNRIHQYNEVLLLLCHPHRE